MKNEEERNVDIYRFTHVLHPSGRAFLIPCSHPVVHSSCPASLLLCIPHALFLSCCAFLMSCTPPGVHSSCYASLLSYIPHVLHPSCHAFLMSSSYPTYLVSQVARITGESQFSRRECYPIFDNKASISNKFDSKRNESVQKCKSSDRKKNINVY